MRVEANVVKIQKNLEERSHLPQTSQTDDRNSKTTHFVRVLQVHLINLIRQREKLI